MYIVLYIYVCVYIYICISMSIYLSICIYIYIYIYYIYIYNIFQIGYIYICTYKKCKSIFDFLWVIIKLWIIYCNYTLNTDWNRCKNILGIWRNELYLFVIFLCQLIAYIQFAKQIPVIHQTWKYVICYWLIRMPNYITMVLLGSIRGVFRVQLNIYHGAFFQK